MQTSDLVLVRGLADTRSILNTWSDRPWPVLGGWMRGSLAITALLLLSVWIVATRATADGWGVTFPGLDGSTHLGHVWGILGRNSLVLALHAFACVAGFIAGSSLPAVAEKQSGVWRWVHDKAGPLAIAFVVAATGFSLVTQTLALGQGTADLAAALEISPALLLAGLLPHALPELVALFLPLAAWMIASRQGDWHVLLAATVATVAVAVPLLVASAFVEVYVTPGVLRSLAG